MISGLNKVIKSNIELQSLVEKAISNNDSNNVILQTLNTNLQQTISNYYACLRLFQKATIKTSNEPSDLAISAVRRSQNALRTIYAN